MDGVFSCRCVAWRRRKRTRQTVSCVRLVGKCWLITTTASTRILVMEGFQKPSLLLKLRRLRVPQVPHFLFDRLSFPIKPTNVCLYKPSVSSFASLVDSHRFVPYFVCCCFKRKYFLCFVFDRFSSENIDCAS